MRILFVCLAVVMLITSVPSMFSTAARHGVLRQGPDPISGDWAIPAAIGIPAMLIERAPEKFYRPPYVGVRGWVGIELDQVTDEELAFHLRGAWRLIAPPKLQAGSEPRQVGVAGD